MKEQDRIQVKACSKMVLGEKGRGGIGGPSPWEEEQIRRRKGENKRPQPPREKEVGDQEGCSVIGYEEIEKSKKIDRRVIEESEGKAHQA